jgi:hypothetical protein
MYKPFTPEDRTEVAERLVKLFAEQNIHPADAVIILTTAIWLFDRENNIDIETSVGMFRKGLTILHDMEGVTCQ